MGVKPPTAHETKTSSDEAAKNQIRKIISGGQTGADQGGLEAAYEEGIPTEGLMPKGFKTEDGNKPEIAAKFGLEQDSSYNYPPRTRKNAAAADVTLWFGNNDSAGYKCTYNACVSANKPFVDVTNKSVEEIVEIIKANKYQVINIAGNRESSNLGIQNYVKAQMRCVINHLKK